MQALSKKGAFTLLAIACLTIMVGGVVAPGLPSIAAGLGVEKEASWLITLPSVGVVLFAPVVGRLIERYGAYRAICAGLFLYSLVGFCEIVFHGPVVVFADRILLGATTAVVMASGTALISEFYEGHARLAMIAKQGMAIELGGVIFLAIGGMLATIGWQWPFSLYLIGWVCLIMVLLFVPAGRHGHAAEAVDMTSEAIPSKLKDAYLAATSSLMIFFIGIIVLPLKFHALGISELHTGYFLSFISLVAVLAASVMPRIIRLLHEHGTLILAFLLYAGAHVVFAVSTAMPDFVIGGILMGTAFGFSVPLVNHMTIERSHPRQRGRNLAYLSMALFLGQLLTSFLAFLPGPPETAFSFAIILSLFVSIIFGGFRLMRESRA